MKNIQNLKKIKNKIYIININKRYWKIKHNAIN